LAVALIGATYQCALERSNTSRSNHQSLTISRVVAFRESGKALDRAVAAFNDAAADKVTLTQARLGFRAALTDHAAQAQAMVDIFGPPKTKLYLADLRQLQLAVEAAKDATTSGPIITALGQVVLVRGQLASAAEAAA
jgi:hypothetical protein